MKFEYLNHEGISLHIHIYIYYVYYMKHFEILFIGKYEIFIGKYEIFITKVYSLIELKKCRKYNN